MLEWSILQDGEGVAYSPF